MPDIACIRAMQLGSELSTINLRQMALHLLSSFVQRAHSTPFLDSRPRTAAIFKLLRFLASNFVHRRDADSATAHR
jgi:hypothetical protein